MDIRDVLKKRKHVVSYDMNVIPDRSLIDYCLKMAHDITPSKQNVFPYTVNVLGPDKQKEKDYVYDIVTSNHKRMEDEALEDGTATYDKDGYSFHINPYYKHIHINPYLLIINQRLHEKANEFYTKQMVRNHYMEQMDAERVKVSKDLGATAVEVGLFTANLTALVVEQNLDISYCLCFERPVKFWKELGFIDYSPVLLVSIGKAKQYRGIVEGDIKTPVGDIIKWR